MMDTPETPKKKVEILPASKELQQKAGTGTIDPAVVQKAQETINNNVVDFVPMAQERLTVLKTALQQARDNQGSDYKALMHALVRPVMGLKADAAMFGYMAVSEIAAGLLNFLESRDHFDGDVFSVVDAHHRTLTALISLKIKGDGGEHGAKFKKELGDLLKRYEVKHHD